MPVPTRLRRLLAAALPAVIVVVFAACSKVGYPNSVFTRHTEFNRDIGHLFDILIWLGTIVFIFVEGILLYTIWRYRRRSESDRPEHVHGNTTLEILWTAIPALILAFIAVPTVRTIFKTQAKASADALQVEVIGHQWWWEFRYPQYNVTTANELYLPVGRKVSFTLKSNDVIHSFWIPQLGGKRDLITNHPNYLWFTPDSVGEQAWNGMCAEYCGASHANMRFKTFTVTAANFESWAAHQASPAVFGAVTPPPGATGQVPTPPGIGTTPGQIGQSIAATSRALGGLPAPGGLAPVQIGRPDSTPTSSPSGLPITGTPSPVNPVGGAPRRPRSAPAAPPVTPVQPAPHDMRTMTAGVQQAGFVAFPRERMPAHVVPSTPIPPGMSFDESLTGDAERGRGFLTQGGGGCVACHMINGNPTMMGVVGPNLTHVGSRATIAGGIYPNDTKHLSLWIKNSRWMKPGVIMPTLGAFQRDPVTGQTIPKSGLTDQQIADIVAYLHALK
jgi:cytochrome c oxidase subunit 2